jgi:ABC-type bacteriocin/lantibiotic exporter with double-glycine peptidase domain
MFKESFKLFFNVYIKKYLGTFITILFLGCFSMASSFINPMFIQILIDNVFSSKNYNVLFYILLGIILLFFLSSITSYFNNFITNKFRASLFKDVSENLFNLVQMSSMKNIQDKNSGDLMSRILGNSQITINTFTGILPQFFLSVISIIFPFFLLIYLNPYLGIITISPVLLFVLISRILGKKMEFVQKQIMESNAIIYSLLKEFISIIPLIRLFNLEKWSMIKFKKGTNEFYINSVNYGKILSWNYFFNSMIMGIPIILVLWQGGILIMNGYMTIGTFTAFISYISMFFSPISQLSLQWTAYKSSLPAFDRIKEINDMVIKETGEKELIVKNGEISFNNVSFSYDKKPILKNFNAKFNKGLNYIVGNNGIGKSTILQLICKLYTPKNGTIKIDKQNINNLNIKSLSKNIAIVFSNPYIFSGTVYENIQIGKLSSKKENIDHVLKLVELSEFINDKKDINVGENGIHLSSGQKQKIALARTILKNAPILLLDEATKSIDFESKKIINKVIKKFKDKKTIIIVTHDLKEINPNNNIIHLK